VIRLLALACLLALLAPAAAAAACPQTSVADLEDEVMCPVCGTSLGVAREAPLAQRERALIGRLAARCQSKRQIKAALVAQYGPSVLALPQDRDSGAYLAPLLGGVAALGVAVLVLARARRRGVARSH
jgi:cytochrome c-type biogenesis protein CcmH/NrfF